MADLLLLRPPDLAARAARPAARAGRHRPQHRQRVDHGLLAPGGRRSPPRRRSRSRRARVQNGAGAHLGSGVDVQAYRRIRDSFLDLQYRAQATRLGEEAGRAEGLDRAELALAEPSDDGINTQLSEFWDAWSDLANAPGRRGRAPGALEQADALAEAFAHRRRRSSRSSAQQAARRVRRAHRARRRGRADRERDRRAQRHDQALRHRRRRAERPAWTARPAARPALRARPGRRSSDHGTTARVDVDVRRRRRPAAGRRHRRATTPPALSEPRRPARRAAGALGRARRDRSTPTATELDAVAARSPTRSTRHSTGGAPFFSVTTRRAPTAATRSPSRSRRADRRAPRHGGQGRQRPRARAIAALRGGAADAGLPRVRRRASAPRCARPTARRPTPRRSPTPSTTAARASPASRSTRR